MVPRLLKKKQMYQWIEVCSVCWATCSTVFCQKLSCQMNCGAFSVTLIVNGKVSSNRHWHLRDKKKFALQNHKWRQYYSLVHLYYLKWFITFYGYSSCRRV